DARVIADEIHAPIIYEGLEHTPAATIDDQTVITVTAASKAWNLPGLKCAQVVLTNETDRAVWRDFFAPHKVGVGTFGLIASAAAYSSGGEWFEQVLAILASNRDLLTSLLAEHVPEARFSPPEGTYLGWLDMTAYGLDHPNRVLREEARVALTAGGPFRGDGAQHVRLNFATDPEILAEIVERIGASTRSL
ncbi:MAG TPA: aminotransferase class I/II-fold pyridoxal phosphate-dependent enzyme, partial [Acidimicrobiia bacterium]|nr:aminotransferase class I/II-fold pyridoxal phosphate-dependent enzyme [Acidimicrobiia bacterium]